MYYMHNKPEVYVMPGIKWLDTGKLTRHLRFKYIWIRPDQNNTLLPDLAAIIIFYSTQKMLSETFYSQHIIIISWEPGK